MVESPPASALVVAKADLLLELLIVPLDAPAQLGKINDQGYALDSSSLNR
jgi:hypothetical protein